MSRSAAANRHEEPSKKAPVLLQAYEWNTPGGGNHWKWLRDNAERFADMGITACWLPPATKGAGQESTGYDMYDLWDMGEFKRTPEAEERTKYGTREELEECMAALKKNGIVVMLDGVYNHKDGAEEAETFKAIMVDQEDRNKDIGEPRDIEGWTKFTFPGRKGKYSEFQWNFNHFTGVDFDQKTGTNAIFRILGEGKTWAPDTDSEKGSFDYLMASDIDHAHPDVREEFFRYAKWLVRTFPITGMRFDAVKHMSRDFLAEFVKVMRDEHRLLRKEQGKPDVDESEGPLFFCVGELWKDDVKTCTDYINKFAFEQQFSLFDCPLHYNFAEAGNAGKDYDLRKIWDGTLVQAQPIDAVTLVENHDTQAGQSLASPVAASFKPLAYAMILLREAGYPCVFLGDLDGCHAENDEQPSVPPMSSLDKFIRARKWFGHGGTIDVWDDAQTVGWVRTGEGEGEEHLDGCAVVMCIGTEEGRKRMEVGKEHAGKKYVDVLGWHQGEVEIGEDGWAEFVCHPSSVSIYAWSEARGIDEFK